MQHIFWITFVPFATMMLLVQFVGRRMIARRERTAADQNANLRAVRSAN